MSRPPPDAWEQLMVLREMTRTTGILHEAQVLQLKMWPYVAVPGLVSHEMAVDPTKKIVSYTFKRDGTRALTETIAGTEALRKNIQALLGDDWRMVFEWASNKKPKGKANGRRTRKARP